MQVFGSGPSSRLSASSELLPSAPSTSNTMQLDTSPVARPMLASGHCVHHLVMIDGSVVASLKPCFVSGVFPQGNKGNTALPSSASSGAVCRKLVLADRYSGQ